MEKTFREYNPKQDYLFPRSFSEYVGENDLCISIRDLVAEELDLSDIYEGYAEIQGRPPFNPTMITALLLYAYSQGVYSSRRIACACEQRAQMAKKIRLAGYRSRVEPCLYGKQSLKVGCLTARLTQINSIFGSFLQYFFLILLSFYNLTPRSGAEVCRRANFLEPAPRGSWFARNLLEPGS
jgi:hypothetical protein